jgi:dihydrofolate reductase
VRDGAYESQAALSTDASPQRAWVIGGVQLYKELLPRCSEVFLTKVKGVHERDAYLPEFEGEFVLTTVREETECSFLHYVRRVW